MTGRLPVRIPRLAGPLGLRLSGPLRPQGVQSSWKFEVSLILLFLLPRFKHSHVINNQESLRIPGVVGRRHCYP